MTAPDTVYGMLERSAARAPDSVAVSVPVEGRSCTYAQLLEQANTVAAGLERLGLRRGDSLALWLPNGIPWLVLEFAAARLGVLVVALNPRYKVHEVAHLLGVAQARVLVFTPEFHDIDFGTMVTSILAGGDAPTVTGAVLVDEPRQGAWTPPDGVTVTRFDELAGEADGGVTSEPAGRAEDPVNVFGTSGTTSFPKLATHDQGAVARHAYEVAELLGYEPSDSLLCFLPFCGAYGFIAMSSMLAACGTLVVMPVYSPEGAIELIESERVTSLFALEGVFRVLFARPELTPSAIASWTKGAIAGVSAESIVERAEREFGLALTNLYGSSELFAMMAGWRLDDPVDVRSVAGGRLVGEHMYARAGDPVSGAVLPDGEAGELQFSGYNVMSGYLANPEADAAAFTADGWYRSGDHGTTLEGGRAVRYESRLADTLRLRGYLVSPTEIEELLVSHGSVSDVEVVGVHDESTGEERAVAFARLVDAPPELEQTLREHCRATAASWKVPDAVVFVAEFPMTPGANGEKVQKTRLREMARELLAERATASSS